MRRHRRPDIVMRPLGRRLLRVAGPAAGELVGLVPGDYRHGALLVPVAHAGDVRAVCQLLRLWLVESRRPA